MGRSRALKLNILTSLFSEFVTLISGLILPRLVLLYFGSSCNGLVGSISQFLGFSAILRAGMGGAIRVALYKPLAENDQRNLSGIMAATTKHMHRIGTIIGVAILLLAVIYPFCVQEEYEWFFAFSMVVIIGITTFADNFFGIKYKILLQADQKYYIQIGTSAFTSILSAATSIILITSGFNIQIVKMGATVAALINPLILNLYVKKNYNLDWKAEPNELAIKQRWDAFFQQVASIVNENIDLVLLTMFLTLKEVSVYTIHYMVVNNIGKVVNSCVSGINSTFGNIIALNEHENLKKTFFFIEWVILSICTVLYSVTALMIPNFLTLYTSSITDVNYMRPDFAMTMIVVTIISSTRIPYQMLVEAAGRFKETRNGAIVEVIVNLIVSIVMIHHYGLIGVIIGTLVASTIRTIEYSVYCMKKILGVSCLHIVKHYILLFATFSLSYLIGRQAFFFKIVNYLTWAENAIIVTVISALITGAVGLVFYRQQVQYLLDRIRINI
jgi:hypothetical protein